jgi:phosphoglycerate dehydrogenase-like enzyme
MSNHDASRRKFFSQIAAASVGMAVAEAPQTGLAADPDPPFPVTSESYPIAEPGRGADLAHVKIVTQDGIPESYQEKIRSYSSNLELKQCSSEEEFGREVRNAHIIYGDFSPENFAAARQLRWIQYPAAGVEHVLWPEVVASQVVLTNMQKMYSPTISETVIGLLLALTRGLNRYALETRERRWNPQEGLKEISGMTMGLVGCGGIGGDTAYRAHYGFHMKVLAVDPKPLPKPAFVAELHSLDWLPQMLPQVDVLVCAAPHTKVSEGMLNESVFRALKPTAYFINVSRGKLVHTPSLVRALREGWIAGAGLDVTDPEPLPSDHPLWTAGNVIITAHSSAHSEGSNRRCVELFCENVRRYVAGLPLLNVVDKKRGY